MFPTSVCTRLFTPQPCVRCHALLTQLAAILANPNTAVGFSGIGNMTSFLLINVMAVAGIFTCVLSVFISMSGKRMGSLP